jgi:hypothetical protein
VDLKACTLLGKGWKRTLNRILVYTVIAILLGTVTMVAPLALLEPEGLVTDAESTPTVPEFTVTVPEATEPSDQQRGSENGETLEGGDLPTEMWTPPEPTPVEPEPSEPVEPSEPSSPEYVITVKTAENTSDLSPIGLMTIPSFLVALGVFVYLRKRIS